MPDICFVEGQPPEPCTVNVEFYRTNGLMLARLSSGEESDFEGEEVHGYLPNPSEVRVSKIGGTDSPYTALSGSAITAMMMLLHAGLLLQGVIIITLIIVLFTGIHTVINRVSVIARRH